MKKAAGIAALAAALATGAASAQDVRGKKAGDWAIGVGVIGVLPDNGGSVTGIGGEPRASNSITPQVDFTYFVLDYVSLNLIAATTKHSLEVRGSAIGNPDLGNVWALPPTLTLQVHPLPRERFSPYFGVGVNYTFFYGEGGKRTAPVNDVDVKNAFGWALNAGLDIELSPRWLVNVDVKKLFLRPDVKVNGGAIKAEANLDPWIVGAGVRYRF